MVAVLAMLAAAAAAAPAPLPLGPKGLHERRLEHRVATGITWTHITRTGAGGPFRADVLAISGRTLRVLTGGDRVPGLERPSAMARRHRALAGVNGGFFAGGAPDTGDPTGVVVRDGELLSEPLGARTALLVPRGGRPRIAPVRWHGRLGAREVDGVNRNRGRIPACGGVGGDRPTERIDTATTCSDASELVVYTRAYGDSTRTARGGVEAVVREGRVASVARAADSAIPRDGYVLSGTGDAAALLRRLRPGDAPDLRLGLGGYTTVMGGAPRLVRRGRVHVTAAAEGRGADTGREPRTLAAVRADGTVLLVTIDGRRAGWSLGATLREAAAVALALGARDAVGLDSGGSTAMVVRGRVVSRPSDPGGERAVADGVFVLPG